MQPHRKKTSPSFAAIAAAACAIAALIYYFGFAGRSPVAQQNARSEQSGQAQSESAAPATEEAQAHVDLTPSQLKAITVAPVATYRFAVEKEAVGSVAYREKDGAGAQPEADAKFVVANVSESDSPFIREGQPVEVRAVAYPRRVFRGKVALVGVTVYDSGGNPAVDPATHRIAVRCAIDDPGNDLYPGMLAAVRIQVQKPVESVSLPVNGVVRNGDGTMAAWVTTDRRRFSQRILKTGLQQDGQDQVLEGLQRGELAVTDGAVFLSNILYAPPSD